MQCYRTKINDVDIYVLTLKDKSNVTKQKGTSCRIYIMTPFVFKQLLLKG